MFGKTKKKGPDRPVEMSGDHLLEVKSEAKRS